MYHNEISGIVYGLSVQAGQITIVSAPLVTDSPNQLVRALNSATVVFESPAGAGRGVRVGTTIVLTLARFAPGATPVPGHPDLVLVERAPDDELFACLGHGQEPAEAFQTVLEHVPGSPVLNQLTGEVCALVTGPNTTTPVPDLRLDPDPRWLDRMEPDQRLASGRRHLTPVLREYLTAVRLLGQQHEYARAEGTAPDLNTIYLERWARNDAEDEDDDFPETIEADELLTIWPDAQVIADPGVGKSSLLRHFAAKTADAWLTGGSSTVVPVPITADAFRGKHLPEVLADGFLPESDLTRSQLVDLFREPPLPGVRWLVLVDGLDEVVDQDQRTAVLRRVRKFRQNDKYRIALTSRHLTPEDIRRFHQSGHPTYVLKPFRYEDLERFVSTWLARAGRPEAEAGQLVARLRDSKLDDLVYVPLIATMVCSLYCASPGADLPRDQTELYQQFVEWQLSKISQHDLGKRLREWQARSGSSAEQVAAEIRDQLLPLLSEIAYGLLSVTPEPSVLDYAAVRHPEADRLALDEALRMSGLVVPRGQELVFRHRTIAEYLAACHLRKTFPKPQWLLEPSWANRWEWPDLNMKVFLAALLVKDNVSIRRQLRHLMWPTFRKQHIGFFAALVRHGVDVDDKMLALAVRRLTKAVRKPSTGDEWLRTVQWLHDIDAEAATGVLRSMAADERGKLSSNRRFEAVRYLILNLDARENRDVLIAYLMSPLVEAIERSSVNKLLAEIDAKLSVEIFTAVASEAPGGAHRLQSAEIILIHDVDLGLKHLASIARHTSSSDDLRIKAVNLASGHDRALGFVLWTEFMVTARLPESRLHAMELLYEHDSAKTVKDLSAARVDREHPPALRHEFAEFLHQRAGKSPKILLDTARHHSVDAEKRVRAALLNRTTDPQAAAAILKDVIRRRKADDPTLMRNIDHLLSLSKSDAVEVMVEVAKDSQEDEGTRLRAAERVPRPEAVELTEHLAGDSTLSDAGRVAMAKTLTRFDQSRGSEALVRIAADTDVDAEERMQAARLARGHGPNAGYRAYAHIVEDRRVEGTIRVEAAILARRAVSHKGAKLLQGLVKENLDGEAQLALAAVLGKADARRILHKVAASALETSHRFTAAKRLHTVAGAKEAALAYQVIADSKTVSAYQQIEAQREADRLSEL